MKPPKFIEKPCRGAVKWLKGQPDWKTAWANCERSDWMWWALIFLPDTLPPKKISVAYIRWCTKQVKGNAKDRILAYYVPAKTENNKIHASARAFHVSYISRPTEQQAQADWIRKHVPCPEIP